MKTYSRVYAKIDLDAVAWNMEQMKKNLKLKFARMEKGLSQIELAEKVGVTRQTIGMMEAGDYNPSLKLCTAICRELGKTLNELFWEAV